MVTFLRSTETMTETASAPHGVVLRLEELAGA